MFNSKHFIRKKLKAPSLQPRVKNQLKRNKHKVVKYCTRAGHTGKNKVFR